MPPRKQKKQTRHHLTEQSDYDSEVFTTDHNGSAQYDYASAAAPKPPARTNEELNLTVLRRHDPDIQQILSVAPFAVVYLFSPTSQTWEKIGVEGTLFVSQLTPETMQDGHVIERYGVMVLNRKGLNNFSTELASEGDVDITEDYVILQVAGEGGDEEVDGARIYGLWIFSEKASSTEHSREVNAQVIMECAIRSGRSREEAYGVLGEVDEGYTGVSGGNDSEEHLGYHSGHNVVHEVEAPVHQPVELAAAGAAGAQQGQRIDLLSLFGASNGPPVQDNNAAQYVQQQQQYQQHPGHFPQGHSTLPHAHPAPGYMAPQMTQAQNLLSLFKR